MYFVKTPRLIRRLLPLMQWHGNEQNSVLYLTFDDGPIPEVTPWVLDQLEQYNAKATFFCVGENIERNSEIYQQVIDAGHVTGNHTYNHLNGWHTDNVTYFNNARKCSKLVNSDLFRPPYGRLKRKQMQFLSRHYKIVMWDILSGDFDKDLEPEECYSNVVKNARSGSIIVFHDSLKSEKNLRYALPKVLKYFSEKGYVFHSLKHDYFVKPSERVIYPEAEHGYVM